MEAALVIGEITEAHAHVVIDGPGNSDRNADAKHGVSDCRNVDVAISQEDETGSKSPDTGKRRQDRARQMHQCE